MQRTLEFRKLNFWSSGLDISKLNEKIFQLNNDGWVVISLISNTNFLGKVASYTLLIEKNE